VGFIKKHPVFDEQTQESAVAALQLDPGILQRLQYVSNKNNRPLLKTIEEALSVYVLWTEVDN
jgi:hypothetical protein